MTRRRIAIGFMALLLMTPLAGRSDAQNFPPVDGEKEIVILAQAQPSGLKVQVMRDERRGTDRNQRVARVDDNWMYCYPVDGTLYVVPRGYVTDFASVPWYGRVFFPQFGQWAEAAVIHDWLYDIGQPGQRKYADEVFKYAIEEQTGGKIASTLMYWAVRLGGGRAYAEAGARREADWLAHFRDGSGKSLQDAQGKPLLDEDHEGVLPFPQPEVAAWRRNYDCAKFDKEAASLAYTYSEERDAFTDKYWTGRRTAVGVR